MKLTNPKLPYSEADFMHAACEGLNKTGKVWLFRNHVGVFKTLDGKRHVHIGEKGMADIFGFVLRRIVPEDVGKRVPVFVAIETKSLKGKLRPDQLKHRFHMERSGVIYVEAHTMGEIFKGLKL